MITQNLIERIEKEIWREGSSWELDWYIDLIFCHALAFGKDPFELNYIQPIIDDHYPDLDINLDIIDRNKDFFRNESNVLELIEKQNNVIKDAQSLIKQLRKNISSLDLDYYYNTQHRLCLLMSSVSIVFDKLIEEEIDRLANTYNIPTERLSNYVIESASKTTLHRSNEELRKIYIEHKDHFDAHFHNRAELHPQVKSKIEKHTQKYGWLNASEKGKHAWKDDDFLIQLKNLINIEQKPKERLKIYLRKYLDNIVKINYNDNIANDLFTQLDYLFQEYLKLSLGNKYIEEIVEQLTFDEIKTALEKKNLPKHAEHLRHRFAFPHNNEVKHSRITEADYQLLYKLLKKVEIKSEEIKGRSACQGSVTGYVKVVKSLKDLSEFEEGYILVAEKTEPSYVMTMKKATAIVTDIGGITSHAAIVSREYNIPCIVATENATKRLKDGDYIKVDAYNGVVEKLTATN